jgi:glutamyl-tRNA reductase
MIKIVNTGMNHQTAPIELRECLASEQTNVMAALEYLRKLPSIKEALFLSTCNRVEFLYATEDSTEAMKGVLDLMSQLGGISGDRFSSHLYNLEDMEAVKHVFRVASSLDSMIVGEPQILGQIKEAYSQAVREKTSGVILNRLMHKAFHVAKRVRTEAAISDAAVSVSYAAVELAKKIFHELQGREVLLIGAGEMAELAARHLMRQHANPITVANRTFQRALQISERFGGKAVSFEEIGLQLVEADIVITSTASKQYVVTFDQVKALLRKRRNRPLFFIDIAVPRDVEPRVNELGNVYVYDIDDLKGVVDFNMEQRRQEAVKAERIVDEEVIKFEKWLKTLEVVPTIISLKNKAEAIRRSEIRKSLSSLGTLTPAQMETLRSLTSSIAEKIINDPILALKKKVDRNSKDLYLDITKQLFNLDQENGNGTNNQE